MKFFFRIFLFLIFVFGFLVFGPQKILATEWFYPMDRLEERPSLKGFGQIIDEKFYVGKENLFPNKFYGYHTGIDLEIFPGGQNTDVPVFAISSGIISFVGHVNGYGGLILEKLGGENLTALYGHLKLRSTSLKTGDFVSAGDKLASLGDAFSTETDGERKHLHFGIFRGSDLYFKGYEQNIKQLEAKWLDPIEFLKARVTTPALEPIIPTLQPTPEPEKEKSTNILSFFIDLIKRILGGLGFK